MESIGKMPEMAKLTLVSIRLTDAGLQHLQKPLKNLRVLFLERNARHQPGNDLPSRILPRSRISDWHLRAWAIRE